jgi:2-polyprenyl-3-methyl-5-hydroxy-6-metoxy-1,4-benzoquinol methylase
MSLFRTQNPEPFVTMKDMDTYHSHEWAEGGSLERIQEDVWIKRYQYEAQLISNTINQNPKIKNVLEIGSGPGVLSQEILKIHPELDYHLIDKPFAEKAFKDKNFKGTFFVKDLAEQFDITGLREKYDLVIMNDFLEHVTNPHLILKTVYNLTHTNSIFFISNPNWRMGHPFIYRGAFDFDNFIFMLHFHCFDLEGFYGSLLKTPFFPKLDSEKMLPDENLTDWNHYFVFKHRD